MKTTPWVLLTTVLILSLIACVPKITVKAGPRTWTVDDDGPANFHTIQTAINAASDGDVILVFSGIYRENVAIGKSLTLRGENPYTTIIDGSAAFTVVHITVNNVVLTNFTIKNAITGVLIDSSYNSGVISNIISNTDDGIWIAFSSRNLISGNTIIHNTVGVYLDSSNNTTVNYNRVTNNSYGIDMENCRSSALTENKITSNNIDGVFAYHSNNCIILRNTMQNNSLGIHLDASNGNNIYHNNFIGNSNQAYAENSNNTWDNGSKGNYWSDYNGTDLDQNGIGDTPYIINVDNADRYPLMNPILFRDIAIIDVACSKTLVGQGFALSIDVSVQNQGDFTETFNLTLYANTTAIVSESVELFSDGSKVVSSTWDTTSFAKGNYTISAVADTLPGETDTADNTLVDGWVVVAMVGDINADGKVDLKDVYAVAKAYGSFIGHPKYNPNCDINCDGKIDLKDYYTTCKKYGKTDP